MLRFLKTGDYKYEKPGKEDKPKLSKTQKRKLKQRAKNEAVVGNVIVIAPGSQSTWEDNTKKEMTSVPAEVAASLFHIDVYAVAGMLSSPSLSVVKPDILIAARLLRHSFAEGACNQEIRAWNQVRRFL
jgi:hypothetical protein